MAHYDIDIMGRSPDEAIAAFESIEIESTKMGLAVNRDKTKCLISIPTKLCKPEQIKKNGKDGNYDFEIDSNFICLGTDVTETTDSSFEIKRRIIFAYTCYFG